MKTMQQTKTKTIMAVALAALAVGGTVAGIIMMSSNNPNTYIGPPVGVNSTVTSSAPTTNTTNPAIPPVSSNETITCVTKSADGLVTNTGYAKKENGAIQYKSAIDTPNGYNGSPCHNDSGWKTDNGNYRGVLNARCTIKGGGGNYIATSQLSKTVSGIKVEGTAWQQKGPSKTTCYAHWADTNCVQVITYAKYSNGPCVKVSSPCDVPMGMTIVDAGTCPAGSNI